MYIIILMNKNYVILAKFHMPTRFIKGTLGSLIQLNQIVVLFIVGIFLVSPHIIIIHLTK